MEREDFLFQWWHSFTPGGMVLIAYGPLKRLIGIAAFIAFLGSLSISWFFVVSWKPVMEEAIARLPEQAEISQGILRWHHTYPIVLGKNSFLSITVNWEGKDNINQNADVQLELGRDDFRIGSLFGFIPFEYSQTVFFDLARSKIEPWWGAWHPILILGIGIVCFTGLLISGSFLAMILTIPVWFICKIFSKRIHFLCCWRIALLGQIPGAIWLILSLFLYSINQLDITGLLISLLIYFLLVGIYLFLVLFFIPGVSRQPRETNPFSAKSSNSFTPNAE